MNKIFTIFLVVALLVVLTGGSVLASPNGQSVNQAGGQQGPCLNCEDCEDCEDTEVISSPSEEAEANKAVALVLASDDFKSLRHSIQEDGLHFDAGQHQAFLIRESEDHHIYIVYFGFEPSVTGSRVGILALVGVSTETTLVIARVDQSSPDPQGLRTVTVQSAAGDTKEFTITWDIEPHNFDWDCFLDCSFYPPPAECLWMIPCCVGFWPCCMVLAACLGIQAVWCAISCG